MNEDYSLVDTSYGTYNGEWSLVSTKNKIQSRQDENNQSLDYALDFTIKIRRRPTIAILTVMFPIITLSIINVFCFVLPIADGETIGMSMAIFLTFAVYATLLSETMPSSADNISWFNIYVTTQVILSAVTIILQSIVLRIYNQDPQNDEYEREVDISGYRLKTTTEGTRKHNPAVGSKEPTTIKTRNNKDIALRMENVFMVCSICINFVSLCLLFANIL
ncbi:5-hydroxytryptamine receptor 3A-like [Ostrea edulis]|uniref:5-hydroxytryptamine receptor 3A-like n=1 Tax=Ostrea edulis TaxID=37623 RepID=UPI0024AF0A5C|nr:5-hydroxytryptamine receptor 3A-like [Ostrea edulis]